MKTIFNFIVLAGGAYGAYYLWKKYKAGELELPFQIELPFGDENGVNNLFDTDPEQPPVSPPHPPAPGGNEPAPTPTAPPVSQTPVVTHPASRHNTAL